MVSTGLPEEKLQRERELAAQRARWEYYKPLILIGFCAVSGSVLALALGHVSMLFAAAISWVLMTAIMLLVYFVSSVTWLGADAPLGMCAVRLAAISSSLILINLIVPFVGWPMLMILFGSAVLLFMIFFDMEKHEAVIFVVLTVGVQIIVLISLASIM
jgi:hypothetical protein